MAPGAASAAVGNVPYQVGGDLGVPSNVSPIGLLPYSPELNPVENL